MPNRAKMPPWSYKGSHTNSCIIRVTNEITSGTSPDKFKKIYLCHHNALDNMIYVGQKYKKQPGIWR
jgi:hypothetical protein